MKGSIDVEFYDSSSYRFGLLAELREVWRYRDFIWQLVWRDVVMRYKRSFLGIAWTMIHPLTMMIVLTIAFSQVFQRTPAYSAYLLCGLIAWQFFSQSTNQAINKLVWGGKLMTTIYMPRTAYAISAVGTGLINLVMAIVPLIAVMAFEGMPIRLSIFFLPISMLLLAMFSLAIGLFVSAIVLYFPDFGEMYSVIIMIWFYLNPIIYPEEILDESTRLWLSRYNPMYNLIRLFRVPVYEGRVPEVNEIWPSVVIVLIALLVGWLFFTWKSDDFAYRI
jgi:ABC-2 type transport system permease protein